MTTSTTSTMPTRSTPVPAPARSARSHPWRVPRLLSALLGLVAAADAALSLAFPSLLAGAEATKGNLRGTAVVVLAVGIPLLAVSAARAEHSVIARIGWLGASAYLLYQGVLFCFGSPMTSLFLLSVAWLGLSVWTLGALLRTLDLEAVAVGPRFPARFVAVLLGTIAGLNGLTWLARIVPTIGDARPGAVLDSSGLLTNPVWVADLALWIPAALVVAVRLWLRRRDAVLLAGGLLAFLTVEGISVAMDQWFGWRADPTVPDVASLSAVPMFLVLALVTGLPLLWFARDVRLSEERRPLP